MLKVFYLNRTEKMSVFICYDRFEIKKRKFIKVFPKQFIFPVVYLLYSYYKCREYITNVINIFSFYIYQIIPTY